jgi:hypothetical protein
LYALCEYYYGFNAPLASEFRPKSLSADVDTCCGQRAIGT